MSNREKCISILDSFSEGQLANIAAMLEAVRTAIDEAADDAFCAQLHAQYEADPERGERVTEDELCRSLGIVL